MISLLLAAFIVAGHGKPATVMILRENDSSNGCEVVRSMEFKLPFRGLVDVKPSEDGRKILALSVYGALARIDVASWTVDYQTDGEDCISAHSLCELPDGKVAVACSNHRNKLMLVDVTEYPHEPARQTRKVLMDEFYGGHGVHWDARRNCLWALAYTNLYKLAYSPETSSVSVLRRWDYSPYAGDPHGHDFVPDGKGGYDFTDNYQVNHFDPDTETFTVGAKFRAIKGFSPSEGGDLYTIAKKDYVTDTLLVLPHGSTDRKAARKLVVPNGSFYKTRWMPVAPVFDDVPVPSSDKSSK